MNNAISIKGLTHNYGQLRALNNVTLTVPHGCLFGLIGPDGAGKTTMYRILATLLSHDRGTVTIEGCDVSSRPDKIRKIIGYMPERFSLYPDLTVMENIEFFASLFGTDIRSNYNLIAPIFDQLARFPNRRSGALSGGMKQKLALCCALIHRPRILLLDEPTTGVDAVSRNEFWKMLSSLRDNGMTIFVSTSYMDEAARCERIALINKGKILDIDSPHSITHKTEDRIFNVSATEMYPLLQALRTFKEIRNCYTFGATLHISVGREFDKQTALGKLHDMGFADVKIEQTESTIEDVFINLT